jgi:hypothetical protein
MPDSSIIKERARRDNSGKEARVLFSYFTRRGAQNASHSVAPGRAGAAASRAWRRLRKINKLARLISNTFACNCPVLHKISAA